MLFHMIKSSLIRIFPYSIIGLLALWTSFVAMSQESHPQQGRFIPPIKSLISQQEFQRYIAAAERLGGTAGSYGEDASESHSSEQYLNSLILSDSPYLIKHASNPINWRSWSSEVLQQAKNDNKLMFLSIGFLTCYWCQMMEKESFVDTGVAKILNEHFVSVKVDRESNPELDQYMINALQQAKGTAGWPVTAILTSDAKIVFIDSYLDKQKLVSVLSNMAQVWRDKPQRLISQSKLFTRLIKKERFSLQSKPAIEPLNSMKLLASSKQHLDMENGGLSGSPKFPEASLLYWLLDQLQREPDEELAEFVNTQLYNMASKGMYDAIHGGFHRYVADAQWHIPHYEKMLYTQALMMQIYSRAYAQFPEPLYKQVVEETLAFLHQFLRAGNNTFFSGLDAVYQGQEGRYYLYQAAEIDSLKSTSESLGGLTFYQKGKLFGIHANDTSRQVLKSVRQWAITKRDKAKLQRDNKVITSWNGLLLSGLQSAWLAFGDEVYRATALKLAESLYSTQIQENVLYRVSYKEKPGQEATLEDYAFFIRGLLDLYDISKEYQWLDNAASLMNMAVQNLTTPVNGFRFSNSKTFSISTMSLQDGELLNPLAVMLENINRLNARMEKQAWQDLREMVAQQLSLQIDKALLGQFYGAKVISDMQTQSIASIGYFANGHGRIRLASQADGSYLFKVTMDKHWHVNSHRPFSEELIPTRINFPNLTDYLVHYPETTTLQFGSSKTPLSVFQQAFSIVVEPNLSKTAESGIEAAEVVLQACNDEKSLCLAPETIRLFSGIGINR